MRYYSIVITDADSGNVIQTASSPDKTATYSSKVNGTTIPGALNVVMDVPVTTFETPAGFGYIRIWGISIAEIAQANDLIGKNVAVSAGMAKGLPLAKPEQSGLIFFGTVVKAFGNWIGNDMTLDLIIGPDAGSPDNPKNISMDWKSGQPLSDALKTTLSTAFPDAKITVNINDKLVLPSDEPGVYESMVSFASYVDGVSRSIIGGDYQGVKILYKQNELVVYDGSTQSDPKNIAFEDMIGQPTWVNVNQIQFKTAMRADLSVGDFIKFPPAITTTSASGAAPIGSGLKQSSIFQGKFQIGFVRHVGDFRQPMSESWVSTFDVYSVPEDSTDSAE